ncbi:MAG: hypothetical protein R2932_06695 [Caldilineaceae bacterium]
MSTAGAAPSFFQERSRGDLLMRLSSNATIREALTSQTLSTVLDGALLCSTAILYNETNLALVTLLLGLAQILILWVQRWVTHIGPTRPGGSC